MADNRHMTCEYESFFDKTTLLFHKVVKDKY